MDILVDTHSHTIVSGHAYSTIREMAKAASEKGLQALAMTEHAPKMPGTCQLFYFMNLDVVPREMYGVQLLFGAELNIMDPDGTVDLPDDVCKDLDIVLASIHPPCYGEGRTKEENTRAYLEVMKKPFVNVIAHPDDGRFPVDYEALVKGARDTHTLLELNNSSMRQNSFRKDTRKNDAIMLDLCKQYGVPVTTGSEAHVDADVGNFCNVREVLEYCNFPEELVVTTDIEKLKPFLNLYKSRV